MTFFEGTRDIIKWILNKIDSFFHWVGRIIDKRQYKRRTETVKFGVFWKYQYIEDFADTKQIAIPYCPKKECHVKLVIDNDEKLFCTEHKEHCILKDGSKEISFKEAQSRVTRIFKSDWDLN